MPIKFVVMLWIGTALIACNRERGDEVVANDPFESRSAAKEEDRFGKGFGKAFRADPNSEPAKVDENDVLPVSYTDEPVVID